MDQKGRQKRKMERGAGER